jgi:hypothetical protein
MDNSEIGIFLYYVLTGIFIYLCVLQIKNDNENNNNK